MPSLLNSINDETVLNSIEKLQIEAIKRCYDKTMTESKTLKTEQARLNRIHAFFEVTAQYEPTFSDKVKSYLLYLTNYGTDELSTGNTIVEQWNTGYHSTLVKKLGIDCSPQCGRHTFSTLANRYKLDPYITKLIMSHSSKNLTLDVYTHKAKNEVIDEISKIPFF